MVNHATSMVPSTETEESLIGRVRLGDEQALAAIYDHFASTIYSIALRVLREEAAAEEVVQEVFLHVWRNPDEYNLQRGALWVRLVMAGRNRAIGRLRGLKAEDRIDDMALCSCVNFGDLAERNCLLEKMHHAMRSLPAIQRQTLELAFFEGRTLVEIAAATGHSVTSVKATSAAPYLRGGMWSVT